MIKITHISDWHGAFRCVPEADVYVCTGDMLKNFISLYLDPYTDEARRLVEPDHEGLMQRRWMTEKGTMRRFLGNKEAPE